MKTTLANPRLCRALFAVFLTFSAAILPIESYAQLPVTINNGQMESPFAKVYQKVSPSVVLIDVKGEVEQRVSQRNMPWPWLVPQQQMQNQGGTRPYEGMGSGVIIDKEGHIITNNHVIESPDETVAEKIVVTLNNDEQYDAELVGRDPQTDLAVIKLDLNGDKLPANYIAELGDSDSLTPGDYAIAVGNPLGLERTITVGVISAIHRSNALMKPRGADKLTYMDFIQTDAQINPGNSGGALADINGKIVGINNMYTATNAGIGFAIPINLAKKISSDLIKSGTVKRGFVGLGGNDITADFQESMDLPSREGILVEEVRDGFPAEKAGLKHGDVITHVDGRKIKDYNDFLFRIADYKPGDEIKIRYIRNGKTKTVDLTLADRDDYIKTVSAGGGTEGSTSWRGINVGNITDNLRGQYNLDDIDDGVVILGIEDGSPAEDTSLEVGDVIIEINNEPTDNIGDFNKLKEEFKDSRKPILIYRLRKLPNGQVRRGYVAVKYK